MWNPFEKNNPLEGINREKEQKLKKARGAIDSAFNNLSSRSEEDIRAKSGKIAE